MLKKGDNMDNINYNLEMEKEIELIKEEGRVPTILLHTMMF